jgi:uncharacterized phage protein (TIGR02218 family)
MSFINTETSNFSSPRELYEFYSASFAQTYYYTSGDTDVVYNSYTYVREAISRTQPELSREAEAQSITVTLPRTSQLAAQWVAFVPPRTVFLKIYRFNTNDTPTPEVVISWQGRVRAVSFNLDSVELNCQPIDTAFNRQGLTANFSSMCQLELYSDLCKVNPLDFRETVTIQTVNGNILGSQDFKVFPSNSQSVELGWWVAGFLERTSTQELSYIIKHLNNGSEVEIVQPFRNLMPGEQLYAYAGCAHNLDSCKNKFDNLVNIRAFMFIPAEGKNPFGSNIKPQGVLV